MSKYQEDKIPVCIEAEEAVLGCLLLDPGAIKLIAHMLKTEHFSLMSHVVFDTTWKVRAISKRSAFAAPGREPLRGAQEEKSSI